MALLREELVLLMRAPDANVAELCRRFGVSRKTAYKWKREFAKDGPAGLRDRSRRPKASPSRTSSEIEDAVLGVREAHPSWGGRKIRSALLRAGTLSEVPAPSTVTEILRRHGRLETGQGEPRNCVRFERERPNELWQLDFKGHFATLSGRCHPLTLLDDHSRFLLGAWACANERGATVRLRLEEAFRRYGLPLRILCDNGGPWAGGAGLSRLEAWFVRLGVRPVHPRPYHPQTQGKLERLHRTLKAEAIAARSFASPEECQRRLDAWRDEYNLERPHESLGQAVPAARYRPSPRSYPDVLAEPEYLPGDLVRRVQQGGWITLHGKDYRLGDGLVGQSVGIRNGAEDGKLDVWFCHLRIACLDLREGEPSVTHVSERV